ncbi:hypothetical protein ACWD6N_03420 [Micromonospora sp. NPDC005163]
MIAEHRRPRRRIVSRAGLGVAAVAVLVAVVVGWIAHDVRVTRAQVAALAVALDQQRRQAQDSGQEPVAPAAEDIIRDPQVVTGPEGPQGPRGQDATDEQVRAAVERYFARNPPKARDPNPTEIAVAVINYLTENPPPAGKDGQDGTDGRDASPEQVAAAVREYLTANPPPAGPKGDKGDPGEQGPGATPQQVADQVEAYLKAHPLPWCPDGTHAETVTVVTTDGAQRIAACVAD